MKTKGIIGKTVLGMVVLLASVSSRAMTVYETDMFADSAFGVTDMVTLEGGTYSASLLNLDIAGGFSNLVFALVTESNTLAMKLTNSIPDSTAMSTIALGAGTYKVVFSGVPTGFSYAAAELSAVPLPPAFGLLAAALGGFAVVTRGKDSRRGSSS